MKKRKIFAWIGDITGCITAVTIFIVPFLFMLVNALKDRKGANKLSLSLPEEFMLSLIHISRFLIKSLERLLQNRL